MKLNRTDYVLERASDGGYYVWLTVNMPVSYTHLTLPTILRV